MAKGKRRRKWPWVLLAVLAAIVGWSWYDIVVASQPNPAEDECSFGEVGNARYRDMLAAARAVVALRSDRLAAAVAAGDDDAIEAILASAYAAVATPGMTPQERIAATHAAMRSVGAELSRYDPYLPFSGALDPTVFRDLWLGYMIDVRRYETPAVIFKFKSLIADIYFWETRDDRRYSLSDKVTFNSMVNYSVDSVVEAAPSAVVNCPPVPTAAWQARYLGQQP